MSGAIFLFTPFGFSFQFCPISSHTYTTTEHYSISDIVNSDKTPIPAAKELYDAKLKLAKEGLAKIEKEDHEKYEKLKGLSDQQLMEAMFPTQVGEYERARSTWKENNKGWLQWVEIDSSGCHYRGECPERRHTRSYPYRSRDSLPGGR